MTLESSTLDRAAAEGATTSPARRGTREHRRVGWRALLHLIGPLLALSLLAPQMIEQQLYRIDWANHLFLINHQAESMRLLGHPTYFLNTDITGQLTPFFMFYGGTLYVISASLALLLGSALAAYIAMYALGMTMAYGGTWWLARQVGVGSLAAHLPALITVSGAYYISNAYGLGHWPEFMAVSTIPLLAAATVSALRAERLRLHHLAPLFLTSMLLTGSHTITAVWGSLFLACAGLAAVIAARAWRERLPVRRLLTLAGVAALAVGVNLWFLLPDLAYARHSFIYLGLVDGDGFNPPHNQDLGELRHLFHLSRNDSHGGGIYVQASLYALAWALMVMALVTLRRGSPLLRRLSAGLLVVLAALIGLFLFAGAWVVLPTLLKGIQSPDRLTSYITLGTAAIFAAGLIAVRHASRPRAWMAAAVAVTALQVGLAAEQAWDADEAGPTRDVTAEPFAPVGDTMLHGARDYRLMLGPEVARPAMTIEVSGRDLADGVATVTRTSPAAGLYATNVAYSPMLELSGGGAYWAGRDADGLAVMGLPDASRAGSPVTLSTQMTKWTKVGVAGTALALVLALLGGLVAWRGQRPGRPAQRPRGGSTLS